MYLEIAALLIIFLYLGYLVYEKQRNDRIVKAIPLIIHVNGIRGKSAVSRLIDAGLRGSKLKVFTKVTGTVPMYIDTYGEEHQVKRLGITTIREQLKILRKAAKEKPDVVVMECMAIDPKLQKILQEKIVKSKISIITNVRKDHLKEMGPKIEDIARSLGGVVPDKGVLILGEEKFKGIFEELCEEKQSKLLIAEERLEGMTLDFPENISVALEVCKYLKLNREEFIKGMKDYYREDMGKFKLLKINGKIIADGLAINDTESIEKIYNILMLKYNNISVLISNRKDRMERGVEIINWAKKNKINKIMLAGDNLAILKKIVNEDGKNIIIENKPEKIVDHLEENEILFMVGNIKGKGKEIMNLLAKEGERIG